jgi:hypothetical protein
VGSSLPLGTNGETDHFNGVTIFTTLHWQNSQQSASSALDFAVGASAAGDVEDDAEADARDGTSVLSAVNPHMNLLNKFRKPTRL